MAVAPKVLASQIPHCVPLVPPDKHAIWSYAIQYEATGTFDITRLFSSPAQSAATSTSPSTQTVRTTIDGVLRVSLVSFVGDTLVAHLSGDINAAAKGAAEQGNVDDVRSLFAHGFDLLYESSGQLVGLLVRREEAAGPVAFARALLSAVQFDVPCTAGQLTRWNSREEDQNGVYDAAYSMVSRPNGAGVLVIRKRKGPYVADPLKRSSQSPIQIRSNAQVTAQVDPRPRRITSIVGIDTQVVSSFDTQFGQSVTRVRLTFAGATTTAGSEDTTSTGEHRLLRLYEPRIDSSSARRASARTLGTHSLADVVAAVRDLDRTDGSAAATTGTFRIAKAFVLLRPSEVDSLSLLLRTEPGSSPSFRTLSAALSSAGTPAAERALAAALQARIADIPASRRLVAALSAIEAPSGLAVHALGDVFDRTADSRVAAEAALAIGNIVPTVSLTNRALADSIVGWLGNQLASPGGDARRIAVVNALGSSSSTHALPMLLMALGDPSPDVRAAATVGVSAFADTTATARLLQVLRTDSSTLVRSRAAAALDSIGDRVTLMHGERDALLSEVDAGVRAQLVKNLWAVRDRWPEIVALMRRLSVTDPSDEVKELIAKLLTTPT